MSKRREILYILILLIGMLTQVACQNSHDSMQDNTASLKLVIRSIETRGVEDLNDDGTVTEEEIYADGRKIYRLAVFLLEGERVVSSTVLEADDSRFENSNSEAVVNFTNLDYNKKYKLYAIANYGEYAGMAGNLSEINDNNLTSGVKVTASTDNICDKSTPYPLTFTKEISLMPGANTVSGELIRTYARLRINVRNQSALNDLYITNLSFPSKFTQSSADIFTEGGVANVSPVVTSNRAITPFTSDLIIPKLDSENKVSETTIFDTYLLESTGGEYSYTLGLKYEGGVEESYSVNSTAINNISNIEDGAMYVMYNINSGRYLYANGTNVSSGTSYLENNNLNMDYVWRFNRTGSNRYTIESMGHNGYFMQSSGITGSLLPLVVAPSETDYFTASTTGNYMRFKSTKNNYYLAVNGTLVHGNNSTSSYRSRRYNFYLYKVEKNQIVTDITHEETIPISIIDKETGITSPMTAIKRNDFIEIGVNVAYNEKTGDVEFEVSNWDEINGEVTFD